MTTRDSILADMDREIDAAVAKAINRLRALAPNVAAGSACSHSDFCR